MTKRITIAIDVPDDEDDLELAHTYVESLHAQMDYWFDETPGYNFDVAVDNVKEADDEDVATPPSS